MADEPTEGASDETPDEELTRLEKAQKAYDVVSDVLTPTRILLLLGAIVVVVVGFVGGWDKVAAVEEAIPTATPSATATATPFEIAVKRARHATELKPVAYPRDGVRFLFVVADVTNRSDRPVGVEVLSKAVTIDAKGLDLDANDVPVGPLVYRLGDAQSARSLQPDVLTPVTLVWSQDATAPVPTEVTVTLNAHTWQRSALEDFEYWQSPTPVVELTLPVEELGAP